MKKNNIIFKNMADNTITLQITKQGSNRGDSVTYGSFEVQKPQNYTNNAAFIGQHPLTTQPEEAISKQAEWTHNNSGKLMSCFEINWGGATESWKNADGTGDPSAWNDTDYYFPSNIETSSDLLRYIFMLRYEIYKLQHPAVVVVTSIQWENTSNVSGTWGTTPNLGNIKLTYSNGTTDTKVYNASGVSLYTDANCTTAFSNANPGTFTVWAKYDNKITTNSKQVVLGKKNLTITKGSSPSSISDGSTSNVTFTTNVDAIITLKTISGTGWTAQLTSSSGTSHIIKVTNTAGGSAGSIAADGIKVTAVAIDATKYNNITSDTGVNTKITLSAPVTITTYYYAGQNSGDMYITNNNYTTIATQSAFTTKDVDMTIGNYLYVVVPSTKTVKITDPAGNFITMNFYNSSMDTYAKTQNIATDEYYLIRSRFAASAKEKWTVKVS